MPFINETFLVIIDLHPRSVERQFSEPIPARVRFTIPVLDRADPAAELITVRLVDREHRSWHAVDLVLHALQRDRLVAVVVFLLEIGRASCRERWRIWA